MVPCYCSPLFLLKCCASNAWKMNNLHKEYINRACTHTHTHPQTHRLFVQARPLLWKMIYSVSSATRITDRLNDWALSLCLCASVNGLSWVGICVRFTATDIVQRWKMGTQNASGLLSSFETKSVSSTWKPLTGAVSLWQQAFGGQTAFSHLSAEHNKW